MIREREGLSENDRDHISKAGRYVSTQGEQFLFVLFLIFFQERFRACTWDSERAEKVQLSRRALWIPGGIKTSLFHPCGFTNGSAGHPKSWVYLREILKSYDWSIGFEYQLCPHTRDLEVLSKSLERWV